VSNFDCCYFFNSSIKSRS